MIDDIKKLSLGSSDFIYKDIFVNNESICVINIETLCSSDSINDFILKKINDNISDIDYFLKNNIPCISFCVSDDCKVVINKLFYGYCVIYYNNLFYCYETKGNLNRSIGEAKRENSINGSMDAFIENFNTNVGLIRKRIHSNDLVLDSLFVGKYSNTKIGIMYVDGICKKSLVSDIRDKIIKINVDMIIDSNFIKKFISKSSLFPTIKSSERPDLVSNTLMEGKIVIICDNSPEVLILPTFFIDYFTNSDDFYMKDSNITFIRIVRVFAFFISIFLPAYYISITTYNSDFIPIKLLVNFINQRSSVPFPSFLECLIMILVFEILRECDIRSKSNMGTSISILGSLVLGDAAVSAGIISPIMIIVVSISAISSLLFTSIEVINAIRTSRFINIILSSLFGLYGIFLGIVILIINLCKNNGMDKYYMYPFAPISFIKKSKNKMYRNKLLTNNIIRGYYE